MLDITPATAARWRYLLREHGVEVEASGAQGRGRRRAASTPGLPDGHRTGMDEMKWLKSRVAELGAEVDELRRKLATAKAANTIPLPETSKEQTSGGRNKILRTALRSLAVLRAGRWRIDELAAELGYGRRQAYRMIDALRGAGIDVEVTHEGIEAFYRVSRDAVEKVMHAAPPKAKEGTS